MQLLEPGVDGPGFLTGATDLVWWACLLAGAVASALILCFATMLVSETRQSCSVLAQSEFMGFGCAAPRRCVGPGAHTLVLRRARTWRAWAPGFIQRRASAWPA